MQQNQGKGSLIKEEYGWSWEMDRLILNESKNAPIRR